MKINRSWRGKNIKRNWLAVLGILAMLLSLLSNPGAGHAQAGASGTVFAWGSNLEGQVNVPAGLTDVTAISAGTYHNLALKGDGTVVAWGCATKDNTPCTVPAGLSGVTAISAGAHHNLALKNDGTVVAWGNNSSGQTNVPAELSGVSAIAGGGWHSLALKGDGTVVAWGSNGFGQGNVPAGLSGIIAIEAGTYHSLALKADGTVVAWGYNDCGQINVPAGLSGVTAISGGDRFSLALKSDGTVVAWGSNSEGQANIPAGLSGVTAISAGGSHSLALKDDGTVVAWGYNRMYQSNVPAGLSGVIAIAGGELHSLALAQTVPAGHYPVALDDSYSTNVNTALTVAAPGVLSNDTDEDGDPLSTLFVSGPAHGTVTLHRDGSFEYIPATNYTGADSFTYRADDGELSSNIARVSITVSQTNHAPVALDQSLTTPRNTPLAITLTATDAENAALTYAIVTAPTNGALSGVAPVLTYTPNVGYAGPDSFTFKANDGAADSNVATVNISVFQVAQPPSALDDSYSTNENTALTVAAPGVLSNDTDENGDTLSALLVSGPAHGTLALNFNGAFGYTPATNYAGQDSFTYQAFDGELSSDIATVSITVSQTNHAPVALDQSVATPKNTPLAITLTATDVENSALTYTIVSGPDHGTLSGAAPNLTYTPNKDYAGDDFVYFKANDGELDSNVAQIAISVTIVSHHPVALDDSYSTNINTALTVAAPGVLSNDTDEDGDTLSVHLVGGPAHGTLTMNTDGSFNYMPATNYAGQDSFTYRAIDGELASNVATASITVSQANHAPVAVDDSYSVSANTTLTVAVPGVLGNDTDVDGNTLTAVLVRRPAHGMLVLNAGGSFVYTPFRNYVGSDSFTYKVNDGELISNVATVSIAVSQANHAPVAVDDSYKMIANTVLTVATPGVLGNDTDADGDTLKAILVRRPAHGMLMLNAGGSFAYKPVRNYAGSDSFTYKVNDGQAGSNIATVNIAIQYSFAGFFEPVKNPGPGPRYVFNSVKAGSAVPVKFSLSGNQGLDIFAAGFPTSQPVSCALIKSSFGIVRTVNAGNSSLSYDPTTDQYTYVWKTDKRWAGTCRVLTVKLDDGTQHLAYFRFK